MNESFDYFNDLLELLIADEAEKIGEQYIINDEKLQKVKELCDVVSFLESEIGFEKFCMGVDETTGKLKFEFVVGFFAVSDKSGGYYTLLENAKRFKISTAGIGESVNLIFEFDSVWDCIEE